MVTGSGQQLVRTPKYALMLQVVFTYLHAITMFICVVRNCNSMAMQSAKHVISSIMHSRNHALYNQILATDRYIESMMPDKLKSLMETYVSISRTNRTGGHHQGADGCMEEISKEAKSWLPNSGIPSGDDWKKLFRNLDGSTQVKPQNNITPRLNSGRCVKIYLIE